MHMFLELLMNSLVSLKQIFNLNEWITTDIRFSNNTTIISTKFDKLYSYQLDKAWLN